MSENFNSSFHRRKIGDTAPQFSRKQVSDINEVVVKRPKRKLAWFAWRPKLPKLPSNNRGWFWRFLGRHWRKLAGLAFALGIMFVGLVAWYSRDLPDPNKIIDRSVALSTKIYDRTGEVLLYEVHGAEKRSLIKIDELPEYVINSTIAIEDKNFYNHGGISIWGILRGQIVPRLQGKRSQGGSTLTQQFVKNAILTDERKLSRKIKEWILSYRIEQKFSKEEILQLYFNEIPYGSSAYGVESAAQYYFDKPAKDLTLAEAAILAALPQAPSYYSPYGNHKDLLIARQQTILDLMVEQDYITEEEAETAKSQELVFKKRAEQIKAPHFVFYVQQLLAEKYGETLLEQSGWKIITSLDWEKQQKAEEILAEQAEKNLENYQANNAALVALDVPTGEIISMVGSKDYFNDEIDGQVNVAVSPRQPGSSLKPLVYLTAFNQGYRPDTILLDLKTKFGYKADGSAYEPNNYDGQEHGAVTMRQALGGSLNIPAVKTLYLAGVRNVTDLAADFGYTTLTDPDRYGLSLVLGGGEVKLLEHVNGYAALAREGVYQDSVAVLKIEDSTGKVIEEKKDIDSRRVIDKKPVRLLNSVLSDNGARAWIFGEANYLTLPDRPVAAKTGTTNDYHDAWTVGFTPQVAVGVWVGNNDNTEMKAGADGSVVAAPIWNKVMRELTKDLPVEGFKTEELDACDKAMVCGKLAGEEIIKIDKLSGKLATELTPYNQIEERKYMQVHNILHYVNRADPLGPAPADPSTDGQYAFWEEPVKAWAEEQGYLTEAPPTEYDDIHLPEYRPSISWLSPQDNQTVRENEFTFRVNVSGPRPVERVEYFIDSRKVGQSTSAPFDFNYQVNPLLNNGRHQLKAMAFDGLDNWQESVINIDLQTERSSSAFNIIWLNPENGANLTANSLPLPVRLSITNPENISKVDFYYINPDQNTNWFGYVENPSSDVVVNWQPASTAPGIYQLYVVVKDTGNNLITAPPVIINLE